MGNYRRVDGWAVSCCLLDVRMSASPLVCPVWEPSAGPPCCFSLNLSMAVKVFEGFRVGLETITPSLSFDGTAAAPAVSGGKEAL